MPRCPRCSKKFADVSRVVKHMNQPLSSCLSYHEEVIRSNAMLAPAGNLAPDINITSLKDSFQQLEEPTDSTPLFDNVLDTQMDDINITQDDSDSSTLPFQELYPGAARTFGCGATFMDVFDADIHAETRKQYPYYPFASKEEWQLAAFLLRSDLSMNSIDKFLKLDLVSNILLILLAVKNDPSMFLDLKNWSLISLCKGSSQLC
jgi:hypothetical protein